jgi:photosystem II stability/assembly factor-like uncharacterized protein
VWVRQNTGISQSLESIHFSDEKHGLAVGWAGAMIRTSDGGEHWQKLKTAVLSSLNDVYLRDASHGWVVGFDGQILRTSDSGATWEVKVAPIRESLKRIAFDKSGRGWIVADTRVLYTSDGGANWHSAEVPGATGLANVIPAGEDILAVSQTGLFRQKAPSDLQDRIRSGS